MKRKYHSRDYQTMMRSRQSLPAWDAVDDILDLLRDNQVIVVVGETGCGKSTQVREFGVYSYLRTYRFMRNLACSFKYLTRVQRER